MPKPFSRRGASRHNRLLSQLPESLHRYNDDISLEDAIHTALLTLKEGFEGQMTEKTIEIGVIGVPSATEESDQARVHGTEEDAVAIPLFRKLSEAEVRDYLSL
jgi:20S proteasome subunit alpha 2